MNDSKIKNMKKTFKSLLSLLNEAEDLTYDETQEFFDFIKDEIEGVNGNYDDEDEDEDEDGLELS